jgi:hypothetical protein
MLEFEHSVHICVSAGSVKLDIMKNLETDKGLCIVLVCTYSNDLFIMPYV